MSADRLKAFTDGVLAIIVTIMVLELRVPHDAALSSLRPLVPVVLSYVLSFVYLIIYWNNHHHLLQLTPRVTGGVLWANAHLLFWLSLVPFVTAWMGENHFTRIPTAAYGVVMFFAGAAYWILELVIIASQGPDSVLAAAIGSDLKGKLSLFIYAISVPLALIQPSLAGALYVVVAVIWLIPDRRIERVVAEEEMAEDRVQPGRKKPGATWP
ncbi:MAG TPA: TMEM175 family protein [Gemmatimonadaceae bacterium]|nr:TMEM175 family protein [Gemmatimonadaceae bacterium]